MKEQELNKLKKVLKPLVMDCIKEAIFEEGVYRHWLPRSFQVWDNNR